MSRGARYCPNMNASKRGEIEWAPDCLWMQCALPCGDASRRTAMPPRSVLNAEYSKNEDQAGRHSQPNPNDDGHTNVDHGHPHLSTSPSGNGQLYFRGPLYLRQVFSLFCCAQGSR